MPIQAKVNLATEMTNYNVEQKDLQGEESQKNQVFCLKVKDVKYEQFTVKSLIGCALTGAGTLLMVL